MSERDRILRERAALREQYGALFDSVSGVLFREDPIGINFETNTDEYEPEVGTILPRLGSCKAASDVTRVVHEEFVRWFGTDTAGEASRYENVAGEIWQLWSERVRAS
jgi:hypothetical protein